MGLFYTNITLQGPTQAEIGEHLAHLGRTAYVSPTVNGITVVYDQECEEQDYAVLTGLAKQLSRQFQCPTLAALLYDDDVFQYGLCRAGEIIDEYDSSPGYFAPGSPKLPPSGGDAACLCTAFGVGEQVTSVNWHLHYTVGADVDYAEEVEPFPEFRHHGIAECLGFPEYASGQGFNTITEFLADSQSGLHGFIKLTPAA